MVDVFISYSRADKAMVAMLAHRVEAAGYQVWWDAELPPHQSYGDVITDKIAQAKAAIVVWSATAVKSEWVRAEADMARNQRKLIQTALDSVTPPLPFNQIQYAEIADWRGEDDHPGWRKVKMSLADLCGSRGEAASPHHDVRQAAASPPPYHNSPAPAVARPSPWPLIGGIGALVVALLVAGALFLFPRKSESPTQIAIHQPVSVNTPATAVTTPSVSASVAQPPADRATTGEERLPEPARSDMEFPDSSTRLLQPGEIESLGPTTLRIARNEIYARKGRRFQDPWLREWFGKYAWYRPLYDNVTLNSVEQRNVALIAAAEQHYQ